MQEYTTLSVLASRPGLSNAQLARRALVAPQSMIEILNKLEDRGLVERTADPNHGRLLMGTLTREGRALLAEADPIIHGIEDTMLASITSRNQETTITGLLTAMENLSHHHNNASR